MTTTEEARTIRYSTCHGLPHAWTEFLPGLRTIDRLEIRSRTVDALRQRLSCDTEPWRICERCGTLITWNEWFGAE